MAKFAIFFVVVLVLSACAGAPTTPCDDYDPVGICATSHSHSYDAR